MPHETEREKERDRAMRFRAFAFARPLRTKKMSLSDGGVAEERQNFSKGNPWHGISGIGVRCVEPGRYSKALLNYLAASNLPERRHTHATQPRLARTLPRGPYVCVIHASARVCARASARTLRVCLNLNLP